MPPVPSQKQLPGYTYTPHVVDPYQWASAYQQALKQQQSSANQPKPKQQGHGGFLSSIISELGGAGGMVGGAAAGAAAGSVVPGIGNVIGGLIGGAVGGFGGGTAGRLAENKIRDNRYNAGSALKEGGWDALFGAGPIKLAKGAVAGASALKAGAPLLPNVERGISTSLLQGGMKAVAKPAAGATLAPTVRQQAGKKLERFGGSLMNAQTNMTRAELRKAGGPRLPEAFSNMNQKYGLNRLEDIADVGRNVTGPNGIHNVGVEGIIGSGKGIKIDENALEVKLDNLFSSKGSNLTPSLRDNLRQNVHQAIQAMYADQPLNPLANPLAVLEQTRSWRGMARDLNRLPSPKSSDKNMATIFTNLSKDFEDRLYSQPGIESALPTVKSDMVKAYQQLAAKAGPSTAKGKAYLKLADESSRIKDISGMRSFQAPWVDMSKVDEATALAKGGAATHLGSPGALRRIGSGVTDYFAPTVGKYVNKAGQAIEGQGAKGAMTAKGSLSRAIAGSVAANGLPSLAPPAGQAQSQQPDGASINDLQPGSQQLAGMGGGQIDPTTGQPLDQVQDQTPQSPYSLEHALSDIQRDPKHASEYLSIYNTVDQTMRANQKQQKAASPFGKPTAQQYALATQGYGSLQNLMRMIQQDPSQVQKTNAFGQGLPVVGGLFQKSYGTSKYHNLANDIATNLLYLKTGAQANAQEIQNFHKNYLPQTGDDPATVNQKLQVLSRQFAPFLNAGGNQSSSQDDLASALSQLQGGGYGY